jgi:hypothetical protein
MINGSHITEFAGLPVVEFVNLDTLAQEYPEPVQPHGLLDAALKDPGSIAWRLRMEEPGGEQLEDLSAYLERFTREVDPAAIRALVIAHIPIEDYWFESEEVRDRLVALAPRLPNLRSLFFGEVLQEESEVSWISHGDFASLFAAFPELTEFFVRGTGDLRLRIGRHENLRRLTVQTGGLPGQVVRDVAASDLPALEHLELWLGVAGYGNDTTTEDLAPVLSGEAFPRLRSLGLRNAQNTGVWVRAVAEAPVVSRLHTLDLSLGTLGDEDAQVLLDAPALRGLTKLDLHHHYLSEEAAERVRAEFTAAGVEVDVSDPQEPEIDEDGEETIVYRYPAVGE